MLGKVYVTKEFQLHFIVLSVTLNCQMLQDELQEILHTWPKKRKHRKVL